MFLPCANPCARLRHASDDRPELLEHLGEGALLCAEVDEHGVNRAGLTPWVLPCFPVSLFDPLEPCSFAGERLFAVPSATTLVLVVFARLFRHGTPRCRAVVLSCARARRLRRCGWPRPIGHFDLAL